VVTATFPANERAGRPIRPTGTQITVTVPRAAVAGLVRPNAAAVTLTANLGTKAAEGTRSLTVIWRDLRSPAVAVPQHGPLTLSASGSAPTVTAAAAGKVTISASRLSLLFTAAPVSVGPIRPYGTPKSSSGTPGRPASIRALCVPRAGQDTTLARIAVTGPTPAGAHVPQGDDPAKCLPFPKHLKLNPHFPLPKPLPGSHVFHQKQNDCVYATGFTNAQKLNGAALVGPGLSDLLLGLTTYLKNTPQYNFLQQDGPAQFQYHGKPELPPIRATLLGFGFMPVSATLQLSEIGSLNIALIACTPTKPKFKCPDNPSHLALILGSVTLHIHDVAVNGVPLNVGSHCQTVSPFDLKLEGLPPAYDFLHLKGVLTGTVNIPQFTGCADGSDNLNPIFDATVSGPGNFAKVTQAPFCAPSVPPPNGCPPLKPHPVH
jgi:hypothetical protein